jgi:tuberous sclerosis protein 1
MRDQLRLQEAEFNKMKAAVKDEQLTNQKLKNAFDKQLEEDTVKIRSLSATEESLTAKINQLEMLIKEQKTANDSLARELELAHHEMFLKDKDIELLRQKANGTTQLKDQVTQLNTELLLMGELHEKYQQRLSETSNTHSTQLINMRLGLQAAAAECSELKCELSAKCVELDAYKARLAELEQDIHIKDVLIGEQKQLLEHTKKEYSSRLELAEQKHVSDLKLITSQQQQILDLHSQLVFHQATATTGSGNIGTCSGKDRVV